MPPFSHRTAQKSLKIAQHRVSVVKTVRIYARVLQIGAVSCFRKSPALRGFVAGACRLSGALLYLVLKSNRGNPPQKRLNRRFNPCRDWDVVLPELMAHSAEHGATPGAHNGSSSGSCMAFVATYSARGICLRSRFRSAFAIALRFFCTPVSGFASWRS